MSKATQLLHKHLPSPVQETTGDSMVLTDAEYNAVLVDIRMMQDSNKRLYHTLTQALNAHRGDADRITAIHAMLDQVAAKTDELTNYFKHFNQVVGSGV